MFFEQQGIEYRYFTNRCWRVVCGCYVKDWPEVIVWNKNVSKAKKKAIPTKAGAKVAKLNGKIVKKIDQKGLSILLANEHFKLQLNDDNVTDSLNLGRAAIELLKLSSCSPSPVPARLSVVRERLALLGIESPLLDSSLSPNPTNPLPEEQS
jgi:hypothetical protein